jgi:hypothetical protein
MVHLYAESTAKWRITKTARHTDTNNKEQQTSTNETNKRILKQLIWTSDQPVAQTCT